MSKSNKIVLSLLFFVVFILLFIMLYKSPFRLDDLAWGGRIGIERLQNHFENYNGRFMGNITVIVLTRLPAILRVLVEMFILFLLVYCAYRIMDRTIISTSVFCILFFAMPITILTQTVTWVSGFSNYIFSTLLTTAVLLIDLETLKKNEKKRWFFNLLLVLLVFVGQLYIETATLYIVVLSVGMIILYGVFYRKFSMTFILQFISSVVGAILMFSNEHYRSAFLNNGETYKSVNIGGSLIELIKTILITFQDSIAQKWFGMNLFLNLVFAAILVVFCIRSERNRIGRIFGGIGLLYVCFFS